MELSNPVDEQQLTCGAYATSSYSHELVIGYEMQESRSAAVHSNV